MAIKAIETSYKGYRFRSRLEARWAVFFDAIGIRWHYELEGFNFDGLCYLPDFYFPDWDVYLEVKPDMPMSDFCDKPNDRIAIVFDDHGHTTLGKFIIASHGLQKQHQDAELRTITEPRLYMLCGSPGIPSLRLSKGQWELVDGSVVLAANCAPHPYGPIIEINAFAFTGGGKELDIWPLYCDGNKASGFTKVDATCTVSKIAESIASSKRLSLYLPGGTARRIYIGDGVVYNHLDLVKAYQAARSARFEHGESGARR